MKDPLEGEGAERELFQTACKLMAGRPLGMVWNVTVNLLVNTIRQTYGRRSDAEAAFNELFGRAKTNLLDVHYDPVTGNRRGVIPHTQVIQAPFHDEGNVIFHGN
jgi:hypothetical protein